MRSGNLISAHVGPDCRGSECLLNQGRHTLPARHLLRSVGSYPHAPMAEGPLLFIFKTVLLYSSSSFIEPFQYQGIYYTFTRKQYSLAPLAMKKAGLHTRKL